MEGSCCRWRRGVAGGRESSCISIKRKAIAARGSGQATGYARDGVILDDLRHPIVLAPLAGGPSTPALAAAVSEAGGLGFLAAGYLDAATLDTRIRELRA